jgi:hypothetical protein
MPVPRRVAKSRISTADVSDFEWGVLTDEIDPEQATKTLDELLAVWHAEPGGAQGGRPTLGDLWLLHGEAIVAEWVKRHPGTRPSCWWRWTAPRQPVGTHPGWYYDGELPEPRRRLGGVGTPKHEVLAYSPEFAYGVPTWWVTQSEADLYNGRGPCPLTRRDGTEHREGDFTGLPPDPLDPPTFESEAAYLRRHGLLLPGEARRLKAADFEPETLLVPDLKETADLPEVSKPAPGASSEE